MARRSLVPLAVALALAALASTGRAQETPKPDAAMAPGPATSRPKKMPVMLRVQITIARYQAERKLASVPYTVLLTTDDRKVRLRMGVEVPIPVTSFSKSGRSIHCPRRYSRTNTSAVQWHRPTESSHGRQITGR